MVTASAPCAKVILAILKCFILNILLGGWGATNTVPEDPGAVRDETTT